MKNSLVKRKVETAFVNFISASNLPDVGERVYRYAETQQAYTPAIFVLAQQPQERTAGSGRYDVPLDFKVVITANEHKTDKTLLERIGGQLETALTGSRNSINSAGDNIFIFQATMPSSGEAITETTYEYLVNLKVICKGF